MFLKFLIKKLKFLPLYLHSKRKVEEQEQPEKTNNDTVWEGFGDPDQVSVSLDQNLEYFRKTLDADQSKDVKLHTFRFGKHAEYRAALIFIDGLVNSSLITESILKPLIFDAEPAELLSKTEVFDIDIVKSAMLCSCDVAESAKLSELTDGCLSGDAVFVAQGLEKGLIINSKGWEKRSVTEPSTEAVIRGPREGFTENFRTNTALLRRRIKSTQLRMDHMIVGEKSKTNICIAYIDGVADPKVVETMKQRISAIDIDSVLDSGYIEQFIEDAPFSMFATIGSTEKPDVAAAKIFEGRVAVVVDGSPFVLTAPMMFVESFQTSEDYYVRTLYASATRLLRYTAFLISVFAPAVYIALTTFHQELIPTILLFRIAATREGTPFPAFLEALIMVFSFEVLREAGLRLPRPVGQAVSIVGALVMGDAAVSAGLVGAPMVITIAITGVAGFVIPEQNNAISLLRVVVMIFAAILGGFGIAMIFIAIFIHLAYLKSFGVPYFQGFSSFRNQQDGFIRMPLWFMVKRPKGIAHGDVTRRKFFVPPAGKNKEQSDDTGRV